MAQISKHRIQTAKRTKLQDVIPLSAPFVVYMDPSSACNLRCKFCPTGERDEIGKTTRWNGVMDLRVFRKAVDDLGEFDVPIKTLKLFKDGEPLMNDRFVEMVSYARASRFVNCIETTTNGVLLTPKLADRIISAGLDRMNISVYGMSGDDYLEFSRAKVNVDKYVDNIRYLYAHRGKCAVHVKTTIGISDQRRLEEFYQTFESCSDSIDVEHLSPFWPGYEFDAKYELPTSERCGTFGQPLVEKSVCPYIFYALAVNSDGSADLCSCDWTHDYLIGDVRRQSLKEIWHSRLLYDEQIRHLKGLRMSHPLCKQCYEISYECIDNIDDYRGALLRRLVKKACQ